MKRFLFLSLLLSLATFSLTAQEVPTQPNTERQEMRGPRSRTASPNARPAQRGNAEGTRPDAEQRAARLAQFLALDEQQTTELTTFMTSSASAMRDELAAAETPEARKAIRDEYQQLSDQKITAMLRPEQLERYDEMKARRAERQAERPANGPRRGMPAQGETDKDEAIEKAPATRGRSGKSKKPQQ